MQATALERYVAGGSPVHRLDPRVKVALTVLFIVSNVLLPDGSWLAFLLAWGLVLLGSVLSDLGPAFVLRRSVLALPFVLVAVSAIFTLPGQPVFDGWVGPWHLVATDAGLLRFSSIVTRSWISVQMAILLVATTAVPDLLHALRHLRVPGAVVAVVSLTYRYLFILSDEVARLLRAREARSAHLPGRPTAPLAWRARVAGHMAGQLFLRSYERSDRVYAAMVARGFRGEVQTISPHVMHGRDWAVAGVALAVLLLLQLVARMRLL